MKFKMKLSYSRWLYNLKLGELLHYAIYKTIVQRQQLACHELAQFLTPKYNEQHGLDSPVLSKTTAKYRPRTRQERKEKLAEHLRLFHKHIEYEELTSTRLDDLMEELAEGQLSYGHAMHDFCTFRYYSYDFVHRRIPKMKRNCKLEVFRDVFSMVKNGVNRKIAPSSYFYMELDSKASQGRIRKQTEEMIVNHLKKENARRDWEDFNKWILAAEAGEDDDELQAETNQLLMGNLLLMKRHAKMGVRLAKIRKQDTEDAQRRDFVAGRLQTLQSEEGEVGEYIDKIF